MLTYETDKTHPISGNLNTKLLTYSFFVQKSLPLHRKIH